MELSGQFWRKCVAQAAVVLVCMLMVVNDGEAYEFDTSKLKDVTGQFEIEYLAATNSDNAIGDLEDEYRISHWDTENGVPMNRIQAIAKSGDGYLWVATYGGLARFDGNRFTAFTKATCKVLNYDAFDVLESHPDGTLFARSGDPNFDYFIRDGQVIRVGKKGKRKPFVRELDVSSDERLLLTPFDDLKRREKGEPIPRTGAFMPDGWSAVPPTTGTATPNDWYYDGAAAELPPDKTAGSYLGVGWQASWHKWTRQTTWYIWPGNRILALKPGTTNWIYQYTFPLIKGIGIGRMFAVDHEGSHWFIGGDGLVMRRQKNGRVAVADLKRGFALDEFVCAFMDEEENIWVGTAQGLFGLQRRSVRMLTVKNGLPSNKTLSIAGRTNGLTAVGTAAGVALLSNEVAVVRWRRTNSFTGNFMRAVFPLANGQVVMSEGLVYERPRFYTLEGLHPVFGLAPSRAIYEDHEKRLWFSGTPGWVARFDENGLTVLSDQLKLPKRSVVSMRQSRDGTMYFGTTYSGDNPVPGTRVWRDGLLTVLNTTNGAGSDRVWTIHEDADGVLWFGTDQGLSRLKNGNFFNFTPADGLPEEYVNTILEDQDGDLWLAGLRGVHRVARRALNNYADGRTNFFAVLSLTEADGMATAETTGENQPNGWQAPDGDLWFPTSQGVAIIDPTRFRSVASRVRLAVEKVVLDDEVIYDSGPSQVKWHYREADGRLKLGPHRGRSALVQFAGIQFGSQHLTEFEVRLDGMDNDWRELGNQRQAFYANIPPGNYQLELRARDNHGIYTEPMLAFSLELVPAIYQRPLFWWTCLALTGLVVWLGHRRRVFQIRRVESLRRVTAVSHERERIARDMHDDLGSRLTHIRMLVELSQKDRAPAGEGDFRKRLWNAAQQAMGAMEEIVWAANPTNDNLVAAVEFYCQYAEEFLHAAGIAVRLDYPKVLPPLAIDPPLRHGLLLALKEVLNNIVRHARASRVELQITWHAPQLTLKVNDDGVGFDAAAWHAQSAGPNGNGNHDGLKNLQSRLQALGSTCLVTSKPGQGTRVELVLVLEVLPA